MNNEEIQITPLMKVIAFLIAECGQDPDLVASIMEKIEAPQNAKGLWTVATRLKRHLLPIMAGADDPSIRQFVQHAGPVCDFIEGSFDRFPEIPDFRFEAAKNKGRSRPGFLTDHPLFGALWVGCDIPGVSTQYDCLRAHLTGGYFRVRPEVTARPYILRNASQFLRMMGAIPEASLEQTSDTQHSCIPSVLQRLPKTWVGTTIFGDLLERMTHEADVAGATDAEVHALFFIADIIRGRLPEQRERAPNQRRPDSERNNNQAHIGKGEPLSLPRQTAPGEDIDVIDHIGCEGGDSGRSGRSGVDDEDILPVDREVKVRPRKPVLDMSGDRLLHIGASNMADAVAAANQMFPFSRAQSTSDDIANLFATLDQIESVAEDLVKLENMVLVEVLVGTGQPLDQCHSAQLSNVEPADRLWLDPFLGVFGFIPWSPKGHRRPPEPMVLPMPARMRSAVALLAHISQIQPGSRLFSTDLKTLEKRLRDALKTISKRTGATLSLSAIGAGMYRTIAQHHGGNQSSPIFITGQPTHRGYLPATYTQISAETLIPIYVTAAKAAHKATFDPAPLQFALDTCVKQCGSSFVPSTSSIQQCVSLLKDQVRATCHLPPRRAGILETHFIYSMYVHCMLAFATGWRPNVLPLPDYRLIDLTTGFCILSDKDDDDAYHTHMVWLADVVIQQLRLWEEHLQLLAERLVIINRDSASTLLWADPIRLSGKRQKDKASWREDPRFLFSLQVDGSRRPILPDQVEEFLQEYLGGKDNGHRHFVRSELIQQGVPDEVVRAILGHWRNGEESFGKFAAMDPWSYRGELARVLPDMLETMGWKALKSPFWKQ